jgi:hypothetical protein
MIRTSTYASPGRDAEKLKEAEYMLRNALPLAVCCLLLVLGCSKKQEAQGPAPRKAAGIQAPTGMVAIGDKPPVFLLKSPVTVSQYVQYLKDSGQPVPASMRPVALGGPGGDQPVSGLTLKEARRCAAWNLMRLPTQQEWAMASVYVPATPYPWSGQDDATPVAAQLYLVQDWTAGSPAQQEAEAAKQALAKTLEQERAAGFEQARKALADLVTQQKSAAQERWDQFKPAFFSMVEKQKALAEAKGRKDAGQDELLLLQNIALEKGKVAKAAAGVEGTLSDAARTYTDKLAQWRTQAEASRQSLENRTKELQQQVVAQTDAFDQLGTKSIADHFAEADALLTQGAQTPAQPSDAADLQSKLVEAAQKLQEAGPLFDSLPAPSYFSNQAAKLQQETTAAGADKATADKVAQVKESIGFGQTINQNFLDEKLLLDDLASLVDLRARRDAIEANLTALTGVMRQIAAPPAASEGAPSPAAAAAPAAPAAPPAPAAAPSRGVMTTP